MARHPNWRSCAHFFVLSEVEGHFRAKPPFDWAQGETLKLIQVATMCKLHKFLTRRRGVAKGKTLNLGVFATLR